MNKSLTKAFQNLDTPKTKHGYLSAYANNFSYPVTKFLELGVNHGQSLIGWSNLYPQAQIIGIDLITNIQTRRFVHRNHNDRIKVEFGNANDPEWLKSISEKYGGFDIVLDDCSHMGIQMKTSFQALWESTKYCYAIEDLQTQFPPYNDQYIEEVNFIHYIESLINRGISKDDVSNQSSFTLDNMTINFQNWVVFFHHKKT